MTDFIENTRDQLIKTLEHTVQTEGKVVQQIAESISLAIGAGHKLLLCGNGGSAADCQHIAAEFVNRFRMERSPLPAVALTTDTSILTAISNDYSFDEVFEKQVQALGQQGDVLLSISTSGRSENILRALKAASHRGLSTVGLTGVNGDKMAPLCDHLLRVQSDDTPRIQEVHIFLGHLLCDLVERMLFGR